MKNLEVTVGYECFAARAKSRAQKEIDTRVGTGDLSVGIRSMAMK